MKKEVQSDGEKRGGRYVGNPLWKRLPREILGDFGKYLVIFLMMLFTIGFCSGFLVADSSMIAAYNESFEKYNIEDGNFTVSEELTSDTLAELENEGIKIEKNFYLDEDIDTNLDGENDGTMRVFINRTGMNLVCLMKGNFPENADEIAIDRMYADNNSLTVGDTIKVGNQELLVTGLVALSDYSCLFEDNSDMMFDSVKFGVSVVTEEGFGAFGTARLTYRYSWQYDTPCADENEEKDRSDDLITVLSEKVSLTGVIPRYLNQAIRFTGDDMGSDKVMIEVLLYILIVIMAFVFAVTTNNTITKEAAVIGTLRASGYTRGELLAHYISAPILVTMIAALLGNIAGYTVFKDICADMYYGSYSLPTYETRWNAEAFLLTTLVPLVLMLAVNLLLISRKLKLSPLKFIRRDLGTSKRKKAARLPHFKFFNRFRLRIILQNKSGYLTLFVGIVFANFLLFFGLLMSPLLAKYQQEVVDNMLSEYQYILNVPETEEGEEDSGSVLSAVLEKLAVSAVYSTENETAEKFAVTSLTYAPENRKSEDFSIYGVSPDSNYVQLPGDGVYISEGCRDKYGIKTGDTITLKEPYGEKKYEFTVTGTYYYPAGLAVFLPISQYREIFGKDADYFNGYFSETEITDLDEKLVAASVTEDDLTKISRQLEVSMGSIFQMFNVFAVAIFAILIYLLTRLIIERNATSISMVKILGYDNKEISGLYLTSTTWVVIFSILVSLWVSTEGMRWLYVYFMSEYSGWMTYYVNPIIYPEMIILGLIAYGVVALLTLRKIKKIPMDEALKNVE